MTAKVGHSIWIPEDLNTMVNNRASTLGLGYNNVIIDALHHYFGVERDQLSLLVQELRMWILQSHDRSNFPLDITFQVFMHIQRTPKLLTLYNEIVEDDANPRAQATLNRRIGQAVSKMLCAKVTARKVTASGCRLIRAYSKLTPG